ncbi:MAG: endonuclease/exonuclease/phosphatase family protein [Oscillatoria princeps RMCB-10]|jgi:endonuclease/exonuclease/phosphatase (EEP) superfamily protein YafD|nr:endonuclease/exonuclease/phosphatase family protein [Oscillatoria princeps RMCB-10]
MIKLYRFLQLTAQLLAYAYSALIVGYLILRLIFGDSLWPVGFVGDFLPWILLPIFLLPIIAFFLLKKRWFAIVSSVACLWLIGWLHVTYFSPQPANISDSQLSVKIFSANFGWHTKSPQALVDLIQSEKPDLICLQEINEDDTEAVFSKLAALYPHHRGRGYHVMLSRYPIRSFQGLHLAGLNEPQERAIIEMNGQDVVIYNISTTPPWINLHKILPFLRIPTYDYPHRPAQIKDLVRRLQKETLPVIAAGDFNLTEQSQDYHNLRAVMQDAFRTAGLGFGFTWPQGWEVNLLTKKLNWKLTFPLVRLDYVWYSQHWGAKSAKVLPGIGSDHMPVEAELRMLP